MKEERARAHRCGGGSPLQGIPRRGQGGLSFCACRGPGETQRPASSFRPFSLHPCPPPPRLPISDPQTPRIITTTDVSGLSLYLCLCRPWDWQPPARRMAVCTGERTELKGSGAQGRDMSWGGTEAGEGRAAPWFQERRLPGAWGPTAQGALPRPTPGLPQPQQSPGQAGARAPGSRALMFLCVLGEGFGVHILGCLWPELSARTTEAS